MAGIVLVQDVGAPSPERAVGASVRLSVIEKFQEQDAEGKRNKGGCVNLNSRDRGSDSSEVPNIQTTPCTHLR